MSERIRCIRTPADHAAALARVHELMDALPGTDDGDELDRLVDLLVEYERATWGPLE